MLFSLLDYFSISCMMKTNSKNHIANGGQPKPEEAN